MFLKTRFTENLLGECDAFVRRYGDLRSSQQSHPQKVTTLALRVVSFLLWNLSYTLSVTQFSLSNAVASSSNPEVCRKCYCRLANFTLVSTEVALCLVWITFEVAWKTLQLTKITFRVACVRLTMNDGNKTYNLPVCRKYNCSSFQTQLSSLPSFKRKRQPLCSSCKSIRFRESQLAGFYWTSRFYAIIFRLRREL